MLNELALVPWDIDVVACSLVVLLSHQGAPRRPCQRADAPARLRAVDGPDCRLLRGVPGLKRLDQLPVAHGIAEREKERRRAGDPLARASRTSERDPVPLDRGFEDPHGISTCRDRDRGIHRTRQAISWSSLLSMDLDETRVRDVCRRLVLCLQRPAKPVPAPRDGEADANRISSRAPDGQAAP